ncbi:MAG: class I SAM-dependent methyltransferase family protein [Promethearchaeota archaeon]
MKFKETLKNKLRGILNQQELSLLPSGFQTIGNKLIIKLNPKILDKKELIGKALLELLPYIKSIYINHGKIKGKFRQPEKIEFLVGENNPIVEHKEHDVTYRFDITQIMFSKGNINERKHLATLVQPKEIIVDMFAGIGYFSLPIAKHSDVEKVYSIELNPISFKYLSENIMINHLEDKIVPIHGDCKEEVIKLSTSGIRADRVIMGVFPAPKDYINDALTLTKKEGTIYHYEGVVDKEHYMELYEEFKEIANEKGYQSNLKSKRFVKSVGPNLYHVVLDILVSKNIKKYQNNSTFFK